MAEKKITDLDRIKAFYVKSVNGGSNGKRSGVRGGRKSGVQGGRRNSSAGGRRGVSRGRSSR